MSDDNVYELFGDAEDGAGDDNEEFAIFSSDEDAEEADPSVVAFMDQQSAEFNAKSEHEFADRYGFVHKCKCDQDYSSGNTVEVTECYANMTLEALDACAILNAENLLLRTLIKQAIGGTIALANNVEEIDGPETD